MSYIHYAQEYYNRRFYENYDLLLEFFELFGHLQVPSRPGKRLLSLLPESRHKEFKQLGRWVETCRRQHRRGELLHFKIVLLDSIGFKWSDQLEKERETIWNNYITRLKAFKDKYGHCSVPENWEKDKELAMWVFVVRSVHSKGKLSNLHFEQLNALGFRWVHEILPRDRDELGRYIPIIKGLLTN